MPRFYLPAAALCASLLAHAADHVSLSANGWSVVAEPVDCRLTIEKDRLGTLLRDVRLSLRGASPLQGCSVEQKDSLISIKTIQPRTAWTLSLAPGALIVSSTSYDALLTAEAPVSKNRMVVRTLDSQGVPVDWIGTQEVQDGYGGQVTHNRSNLPRHNPDVLYFSLGQVAAPVFHSLFDRTTGTAIDFTPETTLALANPISGSLTVTMPVPGSAIIRVVADYFTRVLGVPDYVPFDDSVFDHAPVVWSSWTSYYEAVREEDIVRNTDWLAANLKPYGFTYVQLDDGYDRDAKGQHYWIENWDRKKFPHGPQWLTHYIQSKGLQAGIWLVPNAYAGAVEKHPDWYLRYQKDGSIVQDYNTPALDETNPQAMQRVKQIMTTLDDWGFDYYKFDGEHALPRYIPGVDRTKLHDPHIDPLVSYRARLHMIRDTIGPRRFIEGCPAGTPLNGIGYFNSIFTGHDLYNNWQGMYPLFSSINANAFLNHLVSYVMPGEGLELGTPMTVEEAKVRRPPIVVETARTREDPMTGFGLTDAEARTVVTWVALTGVVYPLASVMSELPPQRVQLLKQTMPPQPVLPIDLFSRGTDMRWDTFKHTRADDYIHNYPDILDLKVNRAAGVYDVAGLTNWRGAAETRSLNLVDKLGLERGRQYVVFDFWNHRLLGVFEGSLPVEIAPHDTRVLSIHPALEHPQVLADSRHITGAQAINQLNWDGAANTLSGTSTIVPGDPYTLYIHVPEGYTHAAAVNGLLAMTFPGESKSIHWSVPFTSVR